MLHGDSGYRPICIALQSDDKKAVYRQISPQPFCFIKEHNLCSYDVTVEHVTSNVRYLLSDQIMKGVMSWARGTHEE